MTALNGLRILVPESRELDLFAAMLEEAGAATLRCPLVRILPLADTGEADAFIDRSIAGEFQDIVLLTGEGLRHLVNYAGSRKEAFVAGLGRMRKIVRGPKPARVLRELGLVPDISAPQPTSGSVLEALVTGPLGGRTIAVQLYPGDGAARLVEGLAEHGAVVTTITPYRYASDADTAQVLAAIEAVIARRIGLVAFTASPQIDRMIAVAAQHERKTALLEALADTPVAAVGPVVEASLARYGISPSLSPNASFHMKPLVRAIIGWWQR
ncbi:uroporphyrinogen-III synthase [Rhizomicrobium electricum]|uniref:Uroporphyrinogen-III synthase n=1 Tax=Rhizomicrobium electricum TaxID=480070 RepID=A0ABN1ES47_9PROT|nr:uroporphyrinogen-III synthase [Rhizomicrobium electricum]NIJ49066.1 uroporphyrinogen-III synthase [Rhizomicrobium electricum]